MSGSDSEGAVKRQREQEVEEDDAPASVQVTAHAEPLALLTVVKAHFDTLVWAQLCNPQGVSVFSFIRLPSRVSRPFAGAPVYDMSLTHAEQLCAVGCGFKGQLVRLLSLGVGRHFEPQRNRRACHKLMQNIARRVAAVLAAALRDEAAKEAKELCASGRCAAAVVPLQRAIYMGDSHSRALKAWLLMDGREGIVQDPDEGFELACEGARSGCHHCQGVLASCYLFGQGCEEDEARSLELALESSGRGSRYGQHTLGMLHRHGGGGLAENPARGFELFRKAAVQGLDGAQFNMGYMCWCGFGVHQNFDDALLLYKRAAVQGYPQALLWVALCHERGQGVAVDVAEAVRWFRRAHAAGDTRAADELQRLGS